MKNLLFTGSAMIQSGSAYPMDVEHFRFPFGDSKNISLVVYRKSIFGYADTREGRITEHVLGDLKNNVTNKHYVVTLLTTAVGRASSTYVISRDIFENMASLGQGQFKNQVYTSRHDLIKRDTYRDDILPEFFLAETLILPQSTISSNVDESPLANPGYVGLSAIAQLITLYDVTQGTPDAAVSRLIRRYVSTHDREKLNRKYLGL